MVALEFVIAARGTLIRHFFLPRSTPITQLPTPFESPAFLPGYVLRGKQDFAKADEDTASSSAGACTNRQHGKKCAKVESDKSAAREPKYAPRSFVNSYNFEPWYFPLPPSSSSISLLPSFDPHPPSAKFRPDGYRLEEIGPVGFERMGHDTVMQEAGRIQGGRVEGP